ncbi:PAS domain-containing protein [Kitasatospora sp. NPDC091335]|uniref:PAS domain-containing protein n=1 Tax=Kitasatospora sp. NPDC091335 TaxID=3364085 RepID=UPI0037F1392E
MRGQEPVPVAPSGSAPEVGDLGAYVVEDSGLIVAVNDHALALLGTARADVLGRDHHELLHRGPDGSVLPRAQCPLMDAVLSRAACSGASTWFARGDGVLLPVQWTATPLPDGRRSGDPGAVPPPPGRHGSRRSRAAVRTRTARPARRDHHLVDVDDERGGDGRPAGRPGAAAPGRLDGDRPHRRHRRHLAHPRGRAPGRPPGPASGAGRADTRRVAAVPDAALARPARHRRLPGRPAGLPRPTRLGHRGRPARTVRRHGHAFGRHRPRPRCQGGPRRAHVGTR